MSTNTTQAAFAYEEPSIATILNQAGLLLVLNVVNVCLDKLLYCGLIGQLFIGILWGSPGAKWISTDLEHVIQQLGYLGLIMLVYEVNSVLSPISWFFPVSDVRQVVCQCQSKH